MNILRVCNGIFENQFKYLEKLCQIILHWLQDHIQAIRSHNPIQSQNHSSNLNNILMDEDLEDE